MDTGTGCRLEVGVPIKLRTPHPCVYRRRSVKHIAICYLSHSYLLKFQPGCRETEKVASW